jgi:DNA-binding transcriptional LysR family regulator
MLPRVHFPHCQRRSGLHERTTSTFPFDRSSQRKWLSVIPLRYERPPLRAATARSGRSQGELCAVGRALNIPQSTASRTIATLEREIGVALFVRTTRAMTLTDAGLDFLARIESVLAELDEAEHARGTGELRGILRIGLGTNFAVREVIPRFRTS